MLLEFFLFQASQPSELPIIKKRKNLLAEEDEVDFISCCDADTVRFIVTPKRLKINVLLHALYAGPMCGLGLLYLLPTTLHGLYSNTGERMMNLLGHNV